MRRAILKFFTGVVALVCFTAGPAFAQGPGQDTVRGDAAVSYSVLHDSAAHRTYPAGFILAVAGDVNKKLRIVAEFGGNYKNISLPGVANFSVQVLTYQGGLRFVPGGKSKLKPFVQLVAGGARQTVIVLGTGQSGSDNAFSLQPGGGVEFPVAKHLDGRFQIDYRSIRDAGAFTSEYRVAFGIVFPFGR